MCTKGGVTEAFVGALRCGRDMLTALTAGMDRCRQLEARTDGPPAPRGLIGNA